MNDNIHKFVRYFVAKQVLLDELDIEIFRNLCIPFSIDGLRDHAFFRSLRQSDKSNLPREIGTYLQDY